jgi:regulator of sigma E protease
MLLNIFYIAIALFALGFSIFIHELGHFIAARKRGLVADRFSIGFGPRIFGWKRGGTDYRISLLPLGGYVSLPQLADMGRFEGAEEDEATEKLPPITYADKMIVAVMGAVFNLIFAFLISLVLWGVGRDIVKTTEVGIVSEQVMNVDEQVVPGPAFEAGLLPGDTILTVDNQRIGDWMQLDNAIMTGVGRNPDTEKPLAVIEVLRGDVTLKFEVNPVLVEVGIDQMRTIGVSPGSELFVSDVIKGFPAAEAGMQVGDILTELDGQPLESSAFLSLYLRNHKGGPINITLKRDEQTMVLPVEPRMVEGRSQPLFGFQYYYAGKIEHVHRNPVEQLSIMVNNMRQTLYALIHTNSDVKVKNMSGPVGIVHGLSKMARYGVIDLIWFLALINVNLAVFNLLPIPVLDGGHMFFATVSKIIGRPLPRKFMENLQVGFVILLLSFVVYVSFFDIKRVGFDIRDDQIAPSESPANLNPAATPEDPLKVQPDTVGD